MDGVNVSWKTAMAAALAAASLLACGRGEGTPEARLEREVRERVPQVEKATGLKFKQPPKVEARSKAEVRQFLLRKFDESQPAQELAGEEAALKLFGLVPDTLKLRDLMVSFYEEQIVGFYDPKTKVLYVVEGGPDDQRGIVITHELVHALQDQYVNLDSIMRFQGDADRTTAAQAVIEGHATYEQFKIMSGGGANIAARIPGGWDRVRQLIRDNRQTAPVFAAAPVVIQEAALFPYLSGADFVHRFREQRPTANLLERFPTSTEQVLHTSAYFDAKPDQPTRVTLAAPAGGTRVHESNMGEFGVRIFLYEHTGNFPAALEAAAGWDGDRYVVVQTPKGNALGWVTVWDSPLDAAQFVEQLEAAVRRRYAAGDPVALTGDAKRWRAQGRALVVTPGEIGGRTVVLYVDAPDGTEGTILDLANVRLEGSN